MKSSLRNKLESLARRLVELDAKLSSEDAVRDMDRYRALTKERADIEPVVARYPRVQLAPRPTSRRPTRWRAIPQMKAFADEEHAAATARMETLAADLQTHAAAAGSQRRAQRVPGNPRRHRAATSRRSSPEACCRMYTRYAERAAGRSRSSPSRRPSSAATRK